MQIPRSFPGKFVEWNENQREEYARKFNELTVEGFQQERAIRVENNANLVASDSQAGKIKAEFVNVPSIVKEQLKEKRGHCDEFTKSLFQQVSALQNSSHTIQRQSSPNET